MNRFGMIGTTALFLLAGFAAPARAYQQDHGKPQKQQQRSKGPKQKQQATRQQSQPRQQATRQQSQPRQQATRQQSQPRQQATRQQSQPRQQATRQQSQPRQQATRQQSQPQQQATRQQSQPQQQATRQQSQPQPQQQATRQQSQPQQQQQVAWQNDRASNWQSQHHTWQQRGGYNGYRIPTNNYNEYYGQDHTFFIDDLPTMYVGSSARFQFGGFWFSLVDPWPETWANNWYASDAMYIVYSGGGYYLCNRMYPQDQIAITIYAN